MLENLINVESLLAVSVGAIFSFKINKANVYIKSERREQSPNINGDNNVVVYNNAMANVRKEISFSVKLCALAIFFFFNVFSLFFINLLSSLSFFLPLFCLFGVVNSIRLNGFSRAGDLLYLFAAVFMSCICYCSSQLLIRHVELYPNLLPLLSHVSDYGVKSLFNAGAQMSSILFIIVSSLACSVLIILSFYLNFAFTIYRNANDAFRYSISILTPGYMLYFLSSGVVFFQNNVGFEYLKAVLLYPFKILNF